MHISLDELTLVRRKQTEYKCVSLVLKLLRSFKLFLDNLANFFYHNDNIVYLTRF